MVYISEKLSETRDNQINQAELTVLLDPTLLRAALQIYRTYCALHSTLTRNPLGVAINRDTHRGQLLFDRKPILLPGECFVPLNQLESEIY
ncbi:MAG: hypothetical protein AB4426_17685 [Xenococcaceae cyanobacterium]